jgi:hypothetical protein
MDEFRRIGLLFYFISHENKFNKLYFNYTKKQIEEFVFTIFKQCNEKSFSYIGWE